MSYQLYQGDCLDVMESLIQEGVQVDLVVCDPPYNVTKNKVDQDVLDLDRMWKCLNQLVKPNGAVILFGQDKFTMKLMMSNVKNHRYNLVWDKVLSTGFLNANRMPLRSHEDICVFYRKLPTYHPQFHKGKPNHNSKDGVVRATKDTNNNYGAFKPQYNNDLGDNKHPKSILTYPKPHPSVAVHPTEKPVPLLEFLIKSYSDEGQTVLDFTFGSCSTGEAALLTRRKFIGIELDPHFFEVGKQRLHQVASTLLNPEEALWKDFLNEQKKEKEEKEKV